MRYFFLLILIAASIGIFTVFIHPRFATISALRTQLAEYQTELKTAQELQSQREQLIATYNSIQKVDLDNIRTLLPDSVDNIRLIIQLDALAQKNGLSTVRSVSYDAGSTVKSTTAAPNPEDAHPYGTFKISFETTGQYKNFLAFIADVEANLRLVDITGVTFQPTTDKNGVVTSMTYKVNITTYWLKQ